MLTLEQNPYGTEVDLRVGIGCGDVVFNDDVWTNRLTPEGMIISEAKRTESLTGKLAPETYILVKLDVKEAAEQAELGIVFGERIYPEAQGFRGGTYQVAVYPELSSPEFGRVQQQATPQPITTEEYFVLALALRRAGDLDAAIASYQKAVELQTELYEAWSNMGVAYGHQGDYERAIECYQKALELKPDDASSWFNFACAYSLKGGPRLAMEKLTRAIELDGSYREKAKTDSGFAPICNELPFRRLVYGDEP